MRVRNVSERCGNRQRLEHERVDGCILLHASHVRDRDKALLKGVLTGGGGGGEEGPEWISSRSYRGEIVPCRFCGSFNGDGHLC